jgi:hypothetical protein
MLLDEQQNQQEAITKLTSLLTSTSESSKEARDLRGTAEVHDSPNRQISDKEAAAIADKLTNMLSFDTRKRDSPHHQFPHRTIANFKAWLGDNEHALDEEEFVQAFQSCCGPKDPSQLLTVHQFNLTTSSIETAYMWCFRQNPLFISGSEPIESLEKMFTLGTEQISKYLTTQPKSRLHLNPDITKNIRKEKAADLLAGFGFERKATRISADDWHIRLAKGLMLCKLFQVLKDDQLHRK